MLREGVLILLFTAALVLLFAGARSALQYLPPEGRALRAELHLYASGEAEGLEETSEALLLLLTSGQRPCRIIIEDDGLNEKGRERAEKLCARRGMELWTREKNS